MRDFIQFLILSVIGAVLLWFGYTLFSGQWYAYRRKQPGRPKKLRRQDSAAAGDPQVCPICSSKLVKGDLVKTLAFPSITGGTDRLMHIKGCVYCIGGDLERNCPVCGASLTGDEILVARMFERPNRSHIHILGCNHCRRLGIM